MFLRHLLIQKINQKKRSLNNFNKLLHGFLGALLLVSHAAFALPNPASGHCIHLGGKLVIQTRGDGGQYGVCLFEDNRQCEEWALLREECPVGGIKITGYTTPAQVYCAITGNQVVMSNSRCVLSNGLQCDLQKFYNGTCS